MRTHPVVMKKRSIKAYCLALALALMTSFAMDAEAKWTRTHAFDCKTLGGAPVDTAFALHNDSTTAEMIALCAIADTDYFLKQNMTELNVHLFAGHASIPAAAMACRSLWSTTGGACGPMASSSVVRQNATLQP